MKRSGWTTHAYCKPGIREDAQPSDWILGMGFAQRGTSERLRYAMQIEEGMTFDEYWNDQLNGTKISLSANGGSSTERVSGFQPPSLSPCP